MVDFKEREKDKGVRWHSMYGKFKYFLIYKFSPLEFQITKLPPRITL